MLTSRTRNENTIYEHQQAAGAKSLNQSNPGLAPKTPAPKTPFKSQIHNENNQQYPTATGAKTGKLNTVALITPANPRTRAPLLNKTTNAKAVGTPFAGGDILPLKSAKPTSPRLRRSKIKVHEAVVVDGSNVVLQSDEPDIEYMAPRGVPLPDLPEDVWPSHRVYPTLDSTNSARECFAAAAFKDDNDDDTDLSDFEGKMRIAENQERLNRREAEEVSKSAKLSSHASHTSTLRAKDAANLLSSRAASTTPRFAAPTITTKARAPSRAGSADLEKGNVSKIRTHPRFAAAKAASNSTIGYSKGRAVSASAHITLSDSFPKHEISAPNGTSSKPHVKELLEQDFQGLTDEGSASGSLDDLYPDDSKDDRDAISDGLEDFQLSLLEDV